MFGIIVKYAPATDRRGARWVASVRDTYGNVRKVTTPYKYHLNETQNVLVAAEEAAARHDFPLGQTPNIVYLPTGGFLVFSWDA